jgi:molecular chaperone GrpE
MKKDKQRKQPHPNPEEPVSQPNNDGQQQPAETSGQEQQPVMVVLTMEEYELLQKQLEQATQQSREYQEGWARERADLQNYRRRMERDQILLSQNITGNVVKKYLTVLDDLERALKACPPEGVGAAWGEGVALIVRKLNSFLESEGVRPIQAEGLMFDPAMHEAITHEDNPDFQSGQIIEVVQQGYTISDRVLRPAMVRVAR